MSERVGKPALDVFLLSYGVTEESGGPGIAATGFAAGLAALGLRVTLVATGSAHGRWLVDEASATARGFRLVRVADDNGPAQAPAMIAAIEALPRDPRRHAVLWANGIWGAQSLAARSLALRNGWRYLVRPAGSLGTEALRYRRTKKRAYYWAVESHILRGAHSIHCMTERERDELPSDLRARAFVVPSGVELPLEPTRSATGRPPRVGVLARLHPIKNHGAVLDAVESLGAAGKPVDLDLAGSTSDEECEAALRRRVDSSPHLAGHVRFLGHVPRDEVATRAAGWRAALLLSDQENFGHAVLAAAAAGTPTVASPGVGLAAEMAEAGAGIVCEPSSAAAAVERLLAGDDAATAERCRAFAARFSWPRCAEALADRLIAAAAAPAEREARP